MLKSLQPQVTLFFSNDVSIMTLTPIVHYCAAATGVPPLPWLVSQYVASNVWSAALFTGNPTNIVVAAAYAMGLLDYSKFMLLPTLGERP